MLLWNFWHEVTHTKRLSLSIDLDLNVLKVQQFSSYSVLALVERLLGTEKQLC